MATLDQVLKTVDRLYERLVARRADITTQFDYFEGKQPLAYATPQWREFHEERYSGFSDNWCGVVGRSPVDRLRIDGFRIGSSTDVLTSDEQTMWADWNANDMEAQSSQGFLSSTIARRSAVLVWGDSDGNPVATWEHPSQVVVEYDPTNRIRRSALKAWIDDDVEYATLYTPDAIYKFSRPASMSKHQRELLAERGFVLPASLGLQGQGGWDQRIVSDESWPLNNPLGEVPIVEWLNRPLLGGEPISDIDGVIALQDAINILWAYMFTAADHASMTARVVLGAEPPKVPVLDTNGQVVGSRPAKMEDLAKGRLMFIPGAGANARIDQWDAAKLDVFGNEVDRVLGHIAGQTQTPGHYLLTNQKFANLNGDALSAAEAPLVTKVQNQQLFYNLAAKATMRLFALVRDNTALANQITSMNGRHFVQWKDAGMQSLAQVADAATKDRAVGMSLRTVLETRYGMTEPEIQRELQRVREEKSDPILGALVGGMNVAPASVAS